MNTNIHFWSNLAQLFLEERYGQKLERKKAHFMFNFFFFENRTVYETVEKFVKSKRPQMKTRFMRISYWTPKATNTLRICNTYCFSTATLVAQTRLSAALFVQQLSR